jgi:hypothetical protein
MTLRQSGDLVSMSQAGDPVADCVFGIGVVGSSSKTHLELLLPVLLPVTTMLDPGGHVPSEFLSTSTSVGVGVVVGPATRLFGQFGGAGT